MTVKKDPKRQLLGKIAKARGKQFESRIDDSFAYYAQKGFAIIEKTPEPMHPTKNLGNGKFIAYYLVLSVRNLQRRDAAARSHVGAHPLQVRKALQIPDEFRGGRLHLQLPFLRRAGRSGL